MKDRFDLETEITNLHTFVDRLNDINYGILDLEISNDDTSNAIAGLAVLLNIQIEKLFDTFKQVHFLDNYSSTKVI